MSTLPLAFNFEPFLSFLVWGAMAVLNLWMFQKTKAQGNMLMLLGAACIGFSGLLVAFESYSMFIAWWLPFIGAVLLLIGFYFTAKPTVDVQLEAIRKKLSDMTAEKKGDGEGGGEGGGSGS